MLLVLQLLLNDWPFRCALLFNNCAKIWNLKKYFSLEWTYKQKQHTLREAFMQLLFFCQRYWEIGVTKNKYIWVGWLQCDISIYCCCWLMGDKETGFWAGIRIFKIKAKKFNPIPIFPGSNCKLEYNLLTAPSCLNCPQQWIIVLDALWRVIFQHIQQYLPNTHTFFSSISYWHNTYCRQFWSLICLINLG